MALAQVGRYRIEREVARGGMGAVYRAHAPDGRPVALKLLLAGKTASPLQRRRVATEIQTLLRLRHENVVELLDAGEHEGVPWLAMEWVEGETLQARLDRDGPLDPRVAVEIVRRVALALEHCHAQGVLHRDLKPDNLMLRASDGAPLLTDFGLSKDVASESQTTIAKTIAGRWLGTPGYWPPEQARGGTDQIGPRSDVYGLGALLYACLTGVPPQEGTTLSELIAALDRSPVPPSQRRPGLPPWLDSVCLRALATEPARRHASASDLARELSELVHAPPGGAATRRRGAAILIACGLAGLALVVAGRARPGPVASAPPADVAPQRTGASRDLPPAPVAPPPPAPEGQPPPQTVPPWMRSLLGEADKLRETDLEKALQLATDATLRGPEIGLAWSVRGNLRKQAGDLEGARQDLDRAIAVDPALPAPRWIRGRLRMEQGDLAGAHEDLERAVALGPDQAYAFAYRAELRIVEGNPVGALEDMLAALLRLRKDDRRGLSLLQANRDRLIETLSTAGLAASAPPGARAAGLWARAEGRALRDDAAGALSDLDESLALDPDRPRPWVLRARLRWGRSRDPVPVLQDLERAVALAPDDPDVVVNRAAFLLEMGHTDEGLQQLDRLLERCPQLQFALGLRGAARAREGDHGAALADFQLALQLDPADRVTLGNRARLLTQSGDYPAAVQDLDRAIALAPSTDELFLRGQLRATLGDHSGALADLERFLELAPSDPNAPAAEQLRAQLGQR